jgi:hypothetical protein
MYIVQSLCNMSYKVGMIYEIEVNVSNMTFGTQSNSKDHIGALLGKTTSNSTWKFNPKMLSKMEARALTRSQYTQKAKYIRVIILCKLYRTHLCENLGYMCKLKPHYWSFFLVVKVCFGFPWQYIVTYQPFG